MDLYPRAVLASTSRLSAWRPPNLASGAASGGWVRVCRCACRRARTPPPESGSCSSRDRPDREDSLAATLVLLGARSCHPGRRRPGAGIATGIDKSARTTKTTRRMGFGSHVLLVTGSLVGDCGRPLVVRRVDRLLPRRPDWGSPGGVERGDVWAFGGSCWSAVEHDPLGSLGSPPW